MMLGKLYEASSWTLELSLACCMRGEMNILLCLGVVGVSCWWLSALTVSCS